MTAARLCRASHCALPGVSTARFERKPTGTENVTTHCGFCHPLSSSEELQAQYGLTSLGSAVYTFGGNKNLSTFCCILRRSLERQLFTPRMKTKEEPCNSVDTSMGLFSCLQNKELNFNHSGSRFELSQNDMTYIWCLWKQASRALQRSFGLVIGSNSAWNVILTTKHALNERTSLHFF